MLITLLVWAYSLILFYIYGTTTSTIIIKIFHLDTDKYQSIPVTTILGLGVVTTITSYLSLLFPISNLAVLILLAGAVLALIWKRGAFLPKFNRPPFIIGIIIFLAGATVLLFSINPPSNPDTALYHAQSIRWIETYRVVPGLANIHYRLAENSSWMLLNAAFSFVFLRIQSLHLAGSVFLLVALLYFSQGFRDLYQRKVAISSISKCILFFASLYIYRGDVSSAGTDLPATLFIWIVMMLLVEKVESADVQFELLSIILFSLSIFAVTVKLSAAPLMGIAVLIILQQIWNHKARNTAILFAIGIFLTLSWLIRSLILSGYLVFPLDQIDIFTFDWKYPHASLDIIRTGIIWFARFPFQKWATLVGLPIQQWLPLWFDNLPLTQKSLFIIALAAPLSLLLIAITRKGRQINLWILPYTLNLIGIFFWVFTAPNVRFGYGFLIGSITLIASPALVLVLRALRQPVSSWMIGSFLLIIILLQGSILLGASNSEMLGQQMIMPADYLPSRANPCPIKNAMLYCHKVANQCNYDLFPCIANPQPNVEMRGTTLQDGFRTIPAP